VSVSQLKTWNKLTSNTIAVGRKLQVAAPATALAQPVVHKVRQGETLHRIASEYNTSVNAILAWNQNEDLSVIRPGDQITIFPGN
jgi:LysM repeat protein